MAKTTYDEMLKSLVRIVIRDENFIPERVKREVAPPDRKIPASLPATIAEFYKEVDFFDMEWTNKKVTDRQARGRVNILALDQVTSAWKEIVWFDHTPKEDPIRQFKILDFMTDETCVGFFQKAKADGALYFCSLGEPPEPLQLDMRGYITLMVAAKGFKFWPRVVLAILDKKDNGESLAFKKHMPKLFPGFKFSEFEALYESVKLK